MLTQGVSACKATSNFVFGKGVSARKVYPGASYHVMNRGNRRGDIFREEQDYEVYLELLERTKKKYPFYLLSYCLMTNHVHLQIETIDYPLYKIIQYVHFNYSRYFNDTYNLVGDLFQATSNFVFGKQCHLDKHTLILKEKSRKCYKAEYTD